MTQSKGNVLNKGSNLEVGDYLQSENGIYQATLQQDGNFVIYAVLGSHKHATWASETWKDRKPKHLTFQQDDNVVIYFESGDPWSPGIQGKGGQRMAMQNDGNLVVYDANGHAVWASNSWNFSYWMAGLPDSLTLKQICMPGAHDAGMYRTDNVATGLALAQGENIGQQLQRGIRYFDLRPQCWHGTIISKTYSGDDRFYVAHGAATGPELTEIFKDIKKFVEKGTQETVILNFSHHKDFNRDEKRDLVDCIVRYFGQYALTDKEKLKSKKYIELPLADLRGKIIILVDFTDDEYKDLILDRNIHGIFHESGGDANLFDHFAYTVNYNDMLDDQLRKFNSFNDSNKLFMVNWTLTPPDSWTSIKYSVLDFAREINPKLTQHEDKRNRLFAPNPHGRTVNIINGDYWNLIGRGVVEACFEVMGRKLT